MKKFIKKLVADVKFSDAGEGHKLNEAAPRPTSAPRAPAPRKEPTSHSKTAGNAALARLQASDSKMSDSMRAAKAQMRREMQQQSASSSSSPAPGPTEPQIIPQVGLRMLCPICRSSHPKRDISQHYEACLETQLELEPLKTTCTMIYTLNSGELLENGVKTLAFFVENIVKSPEEGKYKKIRVNNKGVQKKVVPLCGGVEFLEIAGFQRVTDDSDGEEYFILLQEPDLNHLTNCVGTLKNSCKLTPTLDRDVKVLQPSAGMEKFEVSPDFYKMTLDDVKRAHQRMTTETRQNDVLRTKAMRDKDAGIGMRVYYYTIIRIRFPDGLYLQGTFSSHDTVESLFTFVDKCLRHPVQFSLITHSCPPLKRDKTQLKAAGLVPAATLNLSAAQRTEYTLLSDEMVCKLTEFC